MWDLPRPGLEPVSPALAGRLSTTVPPGRPPRLVLQVKSGRRNCTLSYFSTFFFFVLMNLLPTTAKTRGFTSRSQCLAFSGKTGASAKPGPFSSTTVFFSSRTADACFRPGHGLLGRALHFLMSPYAETDIKCPSSLRWSYCFAGPLSPLHIPAWAPVGI